MIESLPSIGSDSCYLFLVRHASTANNVVVPPRLQGRRVDPGLSPEGRAEATATARALGAVPLAAVFTSPLLRACETATAICQSRHFQPTIVDELIECDMGQWEEKTWREIEQEDATAFRRFHDDPGTNPYAGGENYGQVLARVEPLFARLMQENLGRAIAAVSHKVVNRVYLASLLGVPLSRARELPQFNGAINLVRFRGGRAQALTVNSVWHLDAWAE